MPKPKLKNLEMIFIRSKMNKGFIGVGDGLYGLVDQSPAIYFAQALADGLTQQSSMTLHARPSLTVTALKSMFKRIKKGTLSGRVGGSNDQQKYYFGVIEDGGVSIGCQRFSKEATTRLRRWVGV